MFNIKFYVGKIIIFIFIVFFTTNAFAITQITKLPRKDADIEKIYKLDDGKFIYIEQFVRGNIIWEYDVVEDKFTEISHVWNFIDLASKCDQVNGYNIYFANNLEYFFAGGVRSDNPEIRIFDLYEKNPWRNTDLGISPSMNYASEWCDFYKPYYLKSN